MKQITIWTQDFREFIETWSFYLDKTKVIYNLVNSTNKYYFLSRPRRFWKSLTLSTIKYLYLWQKELFKNTYIYDKWNFEDKYPVLYMDFVWYTQDQDLKEYISNNLKVLIDDKILKLNDLWWRYNMWIILQKIWDKTWKQTVIIVDEYDKAVLQNLTNIEKAEEYRNFFASFYAWVKANDDKIKLFLLTWLTKVLKMSVFSVLNNLQDLSFNPRFYDLIWYTQKEVEENFVEEIVEIAKKDNKTKQEILEKIRINYNWYNFWNETDTIYNPWNINSVMLDKKLWFYWADTWIPSAILNYIDRNNIKVKTFVKKLNEWLLKLTEIDYKLEDLRDIKSEVLFANAGYLTISKYDEENNIYTLWYPNKETEKVMDLFFVKLIKPKYDFSLLEIVANNIYNWIINLNKEELEEWLSSMIYKLMEWVAYEWTKKNPEWWFKTILWLLLRLNTIYFYPELQNIKWRKDFVIPVNDKYYIIEAKVDSSTQEAIEQIDKNYIPQFTDGKEIIKIWMNWDIKGQKVDAEIVDSE